MRNGSLRKLSVVLQVILGFYKHFYFVIQTAQKQVPAALASVSLAASLNLQSKQVHQQLGHYSVNEFILGCLYTE